MIYIEQTSELYNNDFRAMLQAFFKDEKIVTYKEGTTLHFRAVYEDNKVNMELYREDELLYIDTYVGDYTDKAIAKNPIKAIIYKMLVNYTGHELPWGTLTGIRPTKIATDHMENGVSDDDIIKDYEATYLAGINKGKICVEVARKETALYKNIDFENEYCLYIGIPFCPTTCLYCSFTSYPIVSYKDKVEAYIDALIKEMEYVAKAYTNKRLIGIYIGGGTPSSIEARELDKLISNIYDAFDTTYLREFTVEAGRPDSITKDKLEVLKKHKVDRISINPQTMNDKTLKLIGRAHSVEDTKAAYALARELDFQNINMDMIIGLPGENMSDITHTLDEIYKLAPDSLTVHSLAIKRAAKLNIDMEEYRSLITGSTNEMIELVDSYARQLNMAPYYLYRQKNIPGNLENVGYSVEGKECLYNILIMEEKMDIIAIGAGASTKLVYASENRIERVENVKNVDEYISRVEEMIDRKRKQF